MSYGEQSYRILVVGGCHVCGFRVQPEEGFTRQMRQLLCEQFPVEIREFAYANFSSSAQVIKLCREMSPDLLILQMGNYESPYRIGRQWRKALSRFFPGSSRAEAPSLEVAPSSSSSEVDVKDSRLRLYLLDAAHLLCSPLFRLAGAPLFDPRALAQRFETFLLDIRRMYKGEILALSPLPVDTPWKQRLRRIGGEAMRRVATRMGVQYVDARKALSDGGLRGVLSNDAVHMSALGHRRLAEALSSIVMETRLRGLERQAPVHAALPDRQHTA